MPLELDRERGKNWCGDDSIHDRGRGATGGSTATTNFRDHPTCTGATTTSAANAADYDAAGDTAYNEADVVDIALKGTTATSASSAVKASAAR
ncbi:MAG: hypothetical protein U0547_11720 [Dehalococcoidia bacterium]